MSKARAGRPRQGDDDFAGDQYGRPPINTGLKKPVDLKNLEVNADLKGQDARLSNLSFQLFNGEAKAQGGMSLGSPSPPFNGKLLIRGLQMKPVLEALNPDSKVTMSGTAGRTSQSQVAAFPCPN